MVHLAGLVVDDDGILGAKPSISHCIPPMISFHSQSENMTPIFKSMKMSEKKEQKKIPEGLKNNYIYNHSTDFISFYTIFESFVIQSFLPVSVTHNHNKKNLSIRFQCSRNVLSFIQFSIFFCPLLVVYSLSANSCC